MKKIIGYVSIVLLLLLVFGFGSSKSITTSSKKVYEGNNEEVTLRDLALLMSLVYEDVPNATTFGTNDSNDDCFNNGQFTRNCKYAYDEKNWYNRDGFKVRRYIEGLSARKLNLFTAITTTTVEDGTLYYFLNYANVSDAADWEIVNYKSEKSLGSSKSAIMDAVTFRNKNNYVISYRGTDFPDVLEWIQDLLYIKGEHAQADAAYQYAQSEYDRIVSENPNANIYVTGHSLGGYLAQVGGVAIVEREAQLGYTNNSRLAQVAYFNGMGISGLGADNGSIDKWIESLEYLATHDRNGREVSSDTRVTNYKEPSSGRLILYQMGGENASQGDPVSEFGIHFGEVIRLEASKDSINYHNGTHQILINGSWTEWFSTIPISVENYIKQQIDKLKNLSLKTVIEDVKNIFNKKEANTKFTEMVSNTISIIANAAELTNETVSSVFTNQQLPDALKNRIQTALKTGGGLLSLGGDILNSLGDISVVEKANIYHETDSFLCLSDNDSGIPNVTVVEKDEYETNKFVYSKTTTKEEPNATSQVYYGGKGFSLAVDVSNGCARKYEIYETTSGTPRLISTDSTTINVEEYTEGTPKTRMFEIRVYYGNKLQTMVLEDNKYVKHGETEGDYDKFVTHKVEVIYDETAPRCTNTTPDRSINNEGQMRFPQGDNYMEFTCTDDSYILADLIDKKIDRENYKITLTSKVSLKGDVDKVEIKRISNTKIQIKFPFTYKYYSDLPNPKILLVGKVKDYFGNTNEVMLGAIIKLGR